MHAVASGPPGVVVVGQTTDNMYNPVLYVEVGIKKADRVTDALVWFSPDGLTWSRVSADPAVFGSAVMPDVIYADGRYLAVGLTNEPFTPAVWSSTDGVTWTRVEADGERFAGAGMYAVVRGTSGLVALGEASPRVWEERDSRFPFEPLLWTSSDGVEWDLVAEGESLFGGRFPPTAMVALDDRLVAVTGVFGFAGYLQPPLGAWVSVDNGRTWTQTSPEPNGNLTRVNSGVVATSLTGLLHSSDGYNWTELVSFRLLDQAEWSYAQMEPYHVAAAGDLLIVLGWNDAPGVFFSAGPHDRMIAVGPAPSPDR